MKNRLLIINRGQLGTLTDALKWCEYLSARYSITYVGIDSGLPRVKIPNVHEVAVPAIGSRFIRGTLYTFVCLWRIMLFRGKIIVVYYRSCGIFKRLFPFKRMLLDIRTLSISADKEINLRYNNELIRTCKLYDEITAISQGVARKIGLPNINILPLGADRISSSTKNYSDGIRLLYVGTFQGRRLEKTIMGVYLFHQAHPEVPISYILVGDSNHGEGEQLEDMVASLCLGDIVTFMGRQPYSELNRYFDLSNIGISFVPITDYYQDQPPTKTYEYIMSGLYCIATNTKSNACIVTERNGTLINDNAEDVSRALWTYWGKRKCFKQVEIENSIHGYEWKSIIENYLVPIINRL